MEYLVWFCRNLLQPPYQSALKLKRQRQKQNTGLVLAFMRIHLLTKTTSMTIIIKGYLNGTKHILRSARTSGCYLYVFCDFRINLTYFSVTCISVLELLKMSMRISPVKDLDAKT